MSKTAIYLNINKNNTTRIIKRAIFIDYLKLLFLDLLIVDKF